MPLKEMCRGGRPLNDCCRRRREKRITEKKGKEEESLSPRLNLLQRAKKVVYSLSQEEKRGKWDFGVSGYRERAPSVFHHPHGRKNKIPLPSAPLLPFSARKLPGIVFPPICFPPLCSYLPPTVSGYTKETEGKYMGKWTSFPKKEIQTRTQNNAASVLRVVPGAFFLVWISVLT